ncbi:hypothetical protein Cni_G10007 [Canna indica]|uniref:TRAF-type domain-containing protein n=1 Tax=Canna indica TaxID=4628 RepID=A0AAQ3Q9H5_9LILI|nr:hypothetical protein Cni_G10007 [Canna indica]
MSSEIIDEPVVGNTSHYLKQQASKGDGKSMEASIKLMRDSAMDGVYFIFYSAIYPEFHGFFPFYIESEQATARVSTAREREREGRNTSGERRALCCRRVVNIATVTPVVAMSSPTSPRCDPLMRAVAIIMISSSSLGNLAVLNWNTTVLQDANAKKRKKPRLASSTTTMARRSNDDDANTKKLKCRGLLRSKLLEMGVNLHSPVCPLRKAITRSDIDRGQHRLQLPKDRLNFPLLESVMTAGEKKQMSEKKGLAVKVLDRMGREYDLVLRFVASIRTYRIMGQDYTKLVEENSFRVGQFLDLWLFRVGASGEGESMASSTGPEAVGELRLVALVDEDGEEADDQVQVLDDGGASAAARGNGGGNIEDEISSILLSLGRGVEEMRAQLCYRLLECIIYHSLLRVPFFVHHLVLEINLFRFWLRLHWQKVWCPRIELFPLNVHFHILELLIVTVECWSAGVLGSRRRRAYQSSGDGSRRGPPRLLLRFELKGAMDAPESDPGSGDVSELDHCDQCDMDIVQKIAKLLLQALGTACVDNITGLFKSPASVAVILRKELVDYLKKRSQMSIAEASVKGDVNMNTAAEYSKDPTEIISVFLDDFASLKRNFFSRVSGWLSSERRQEKIDDFVKEMERNAFWSLNRRVAIAEILLRNIDLKSTFHCSIKFDSAEQFAEHKSQCVFRILNCTNDGCNTEFSAIYAEKHDSECPFKAIPCEQKCLENIARCQMEEHCSTVCPMKLVKCPFYQVGCVDSIPQCHLAEHCSECVHSHLLCVLQVFLEQENSVEELKQRVKLLEKSQSLSELSGALDVRSLTLVIKEQEAKMKKLENELNKLRDKQASMIKNVK